MAEVSEERLEVTEEIPTGFEEPSRRIPAKAVFILIVAAVAVAGVVVYLVTTGQFGGAPTGGKEGGGEMKILDITHSPQNPSPGENITLTATIEGTSGYVPHDEYNYYFGTGLGAGLSGGGGMWDSVSNGNYTRGLYSADNGTEISYFVIVWNSDGNPTISDEHIIQVGHVERSDITTLSISNVNHDPPPSSGTMSSIHVYATVQSDAPSIDVDIIYTFARKGGSSGGGSGGGTLSENTYEGRIYGAPDSGWSSGTVVKYKIVAKDNMANTACSEWFTLNIP